MTRLEFRVKVFTFHTNQFMWHYRVSGVIHHEKWPASFPDYRKKFGEIWGKKK